MSTHAFTLMITNAHPNTEGLEDRLFKAGCDDALICMRNDEVHLDFERESESRETAIECAIAAIRQAGFSSFLSAPNHPRSGWSNPKRWLGADEEQNTLEHIENDSFNTKDDWRW